MTKKIVHIDDFESVCGYSYRHEPFCNGGHNCRHPDSAKEDGVGYCYAFQCPLAPTADEDDFADAGIDAEEFEEDMYVVLYEEDKA